MGTVIAVYWFNKESMTRSYFYFFSLLRIGITSHVEDFPLLEQKEWNEIYKLSINQAVSGVILEAIELLPADKRPNKALIFQFIGLGAKITARNRQINIAALELCNNLRVKGYDVCLLKGQGVASLYPKPYARVPGDIDIWMRTSRKRVISFLEEEYGTKVGVCYLHAIVPQRHNGVEVEYHFYPTFSYSPLINRRIHRILNGCFRETIIQLPDGVGNVPVPNYEFNLVFMLNHIYRHLISEGIGIRQIIDYYVLLNSNHGLHNCCLKNDIESILKSLGMLSFAKGLMWMMHETLHLSEDLMIVSPDEKEGRFLLDEIMMSGNFGCHDSRFGTKTTTKFDRAMTKIRRSLHFIAHYPQEVLFRFPFMIYETLFYKIPHR